MDEESSETFVQQTSPLTSAGTRDDAYDLDLDGRRHSATYRRVSSQDDFDVDGPRDADYLHDYQRYLEVCDDVNDDDAGVGLLHVFDSSIAVFEPGATIRRGSSPDGGTDLNALRPQSVGAVASLRRQSIDGATVLLRPQSVGGAVTAGARQSPWRSDGRLESTGGTPEGVRPQFTDGTTTVRQQQSADGAARVRSQRTYEGAVVDRSRSSTEIVSVVRPHSTGGATYNFGSGT